MTVRPRKIILMAGALVIVITTAYLIDFFMNDTTLEFRLIDRESGSWVWNAGVRIQDRELRSYFQSSEGPVTLRITRLTPGRATLTVTAPFYEPTSLPITLRRGQNRIPDPVTVAGREIPGLTAFHVTSSDSSNGITFSIRAVDAEGKTISNHPCVPLLFGGTLYTVTPFRTRGDIIHKGLIPWTWEPAPQAFERYRGYLPAPGAPAWVLDYFIILPKPEALGSWDPDRLATDLGTMQNEGDALTYLESRQGTVRFFTGTMTGGSR